MADVASLDHKPDEGVADGCEAAHTLARVTLALQASLMAPAIVADLAETFRLLGDGTRVRILDALSRSEMCVCDLAALLGVSNSAVSHQLRLLRGMRVVRHRRAGRMVFYALDDEHVVHLFSEALKHVQERS
jgi:ArsR family transcriptional regulator